MRRRLSWLLFALLLAACGGAGELSGLPPVSEPPKISVLPKPGAYELYELDVTVAVSAPAGTDVYYDLDKAPDTASPRLRSPLKLRLVRSTRIQVLAVHGGRTWGPYLFEYALTAPRPGLGSCLVRPFAKYWYKNGERVPAAFAYRFSTALSALYAVVDGQETALAVPGGQSDGSASAMLGPLAEGKHSVGCLVRSPRLEDVGGDPLTIEFDTHPPLVSWVEAGGAFDRASWPGRFGLQAADGLSGLAAGQICAGLACLPLERRDGGLYVYATALTAHTSASASLTAAVYDVAGNAAVLPVLALDVSAFDEPDLPPPAAITLTTEAVIDLPARLGRGVSEVCDLLLTAPCFTPAAVPLAEGWNDFVFRAGAGTAWESFAIFRAGLAAALPAGPGPWLVYASASTGPLLQASLVAVTTAAAGAFTRAWFDVPHLAFVEDRNANGRYDPYDGLFTVATDALRGAYDRRQAPVVTALTRYVYPDAGGAVTAAVSCPAACTAPGRLVAESRASLFGYPVTHVEWGAGLPAAVTLAAAPGDWCLFFWDESGDGVVNGGEPRAVGSCAAPAFTLARKDGVLRFAGALQGVPYGGAVTRSLELLAPSGAVLARYPKPALADTDGLGVLTGAMGWSDGPGYPPPGVAARMRFAAAGEVTAVAYAGAPRVTPPVSYAVAVTDELGAPIEALVQLRSGGSIADATATDSLGNAVVGTAALETQLAAVALRDGYLAYARAVTQSPVALQLLSPAVTGRVTGLVVDALGAPVPGAAVAWRAGNYESSAVSAADGSYALAASGGAGVLLVGAFGAHARSASFALVVTRETVVQSVVLEADAAPGWPRGPWWSAVPEVWGGELRYDDAYYGIAVTGAGPVTVAHAGIRREVTLPGALPAPDYHAYFPVGVTTPFAAQLNLRAECGARWQPVNAAAQIDSPCWQLVGGDELQRYVFARLDPAVPYAEPPAMARFYANVSVGGGVPPDQVLTFHEQLIPRVIRLPLSLGAVYGFLPFGVYRVETEDGQWAPDEVVVSDAYPAFSTIVVP
jgi:hypothetical protein